jgi:hypothetical protein
MRISAAQATKKETIYEDELPPDSLFQTKKFIAYKARVENIIRNSKGELTIRQIKRRLGRHLIDGWLWDALRQLSGKTITAREKTANITVYRYQVSEEKQAPVLAFNHEISPRQSLPYMQL